MIHQVAPIIAQAIVQSLLAGIICFAALKVVLALLSNIRSLYKYHLSNIAMLIPLVAFLIPLGQLRHIQPAPIAEVVSSGPTTLPHTVTAAATNYQPLQTTTATTTPEAATNLTAEQLWAMANNAIMQYSDIIMWLYLAGLLLFSIRLLVQYKQSRDLKTKGLLPVDDKWQELLKSAREKLGITGKVSIAFTKRKISPCIIGHAKAVILIPVTIANNLSTEQAEAILLHELAHYKQYDHYINLALQFVKCVLFFNPFVWLTTKLSDKHREHSCDEAATRHERNIELAETLALIARMHTTQNSLSLNLKKGSPLLGRIQALLKVNGTDKTSNRLLPVLLTSIVLVTTLLFVGTPDIFSKEKDRLRERLENISRQMYEEGNVRYVFVDAVLDSLVTLPLEQGEFVHMGSHYMVMRAGTNTISMSGKKGLAYLQKLQQFFEQHGEDKEKTVLFDAMPGGETLTLDMILDASSPFRHYSVKDRYKIGMTAAAWRVIFEELEKDQYVSRDDEEFLLEYGPSKGILINGKAMENGYYRKYYKLFKDVLGIELNKDKISGNMNILALREYLPKDGDKTGSVQPTEEELDRAIHDMYENGNDRFIVVQMVKDGIISNGETYHLTFNDGKFEAKGEQLTTEQKTKYAQMLRTFKRHHKDTVSVFSSTRSHLDYAMIVDTNERFRNNRFNITPVFSSMVLFTDSFINMMHEDGLLDTGYQYKINYSNDGLVVNNKPVTGKVADKYINIFLSYYRDMNTRKKFSISHRDNTDRPFPSDNKKAMRVLSDKLFEEGVDAFVEVDAVLDGYIDKEEAYIMHYKNDKFWIEGKDMPVVVRERYAAKLKKYTELHKDKKSMWHTLTKTASGIKATPLYDNEFGINKPHKEKLSTAELNNIIKEMYDSACQNFILAEAYRDGYLKDGEKFVANYRNKRFWIDGVDIPKTKEAYYSKRLQEFEKEYGQYYNVWGKFETTFESNELTDRKSGIWELMFHKPQDMSTGTVTARGNGDSHLKVYTPKKGDSVSIEGGDFVVHNDEELNKKKEKALKEMIAAMHEDKLLDSTSYHKIEYRSDGVYVNAQRLSGMTGNKYIAKFNAMGYKPGNGFTREYIPEGVAVPDRKIGNSTIHIPVHSNNLQGIADKMFTEGNPHFILAHALKDGLLKEREHYNIMYDHGTVAFDGTLLPEPMQSKYVKLWEDFFKAHKRSDTYNYSIRGGGVTIKELNNPKSGIRDDHALLDNYRYVNGKYFTNHVIDLMARDGLVDTTGKYEMKYNWRGVIVNGKKLNDKEAKPYEEILLKGFGHKPKFPDDAVIVSSE